MKCERQGLAAGPDGRCGVCHRPYALTGRLRAEREDRALRRIAKIAVAVGAGFAAFAALLALCDTR